MQNRIRRLDHKLEFRLAQIRQTQNLRLWTAGVGFLALVAAAIWQSLHLGPFVVVFFVIVFSFFVSRNRILSASAEQLTRLRDFYLRQSFRLRGEPLPEFKDRPQLEPGADIDLTGPHSLLSLLDETFSLGGQDRLTSWLLNRPQDLVRILSRQKQIMALHKHIWFLRKWRSRAPSQGDFKISSSASAQVLKDFLEQPEMTLLTALLVILWLAWLTSLGFYLTGTMSAVKITPLLLVGFAAAHFALLGQLGPVFKKGEGLVHHLGLMAPIFSFLETPQAAQVLPTQIRQIQNLRPAHNLKYLGRLLALLSLEANPLVYLLVNIFTPWNSILSLLLIKRTKKFALNFDGCLEELYELEALSSLVHFYHHQTRVFPHLSEKPQLKFEGLYHPLLRREKAVANDFSFADRERMGLITGSNMSGKSTFLRAVGLNQILANIGAPIFARSMTTSLMEVETCIQVHDSLRDGFSYFFAEVQKLKTLLTRVAQGPAVLYLVDEIFRGTNNRERQIGSRAVIEELAQHPSLGFVSTHDLELTEIAHDQPAVRNVHFRDDVEDERMIFHYKIHEGPCPTTNALKIMRVAGFKV